MPGPANRREEAVARARADIEHGDLGKARRRLKTTLRNLGYDPELISLLGKISHDMRDPFEAGRYWLCSTAEGEEVERDIATFVAQAGGKPESVRSQLPRALRLGSLDKYPPGVQERLRRLQLTDAVVRSTVRVIELPSVEDTRSIRILFGVVLSAIILWCVASCVAGTYAIVRYFVSE